MHQLLQLRFSRPPRRHLTNYSSAQKIVDYINRVFTYNLKLRENINDLVKRFSNEFDLILQDPLASSFEMNDTYVRHLSTGKEEGDYSAIFISRKVVKIMKCHIYNGWMKRSDQTYPLTEFQEKEFSSDMLVALVAEQAIHFTAEVDEELGETALTCCPNVINSVAIDRAILSRNGLELNALLTSYLTTLGKKIDIRAVVSSSAASFIDSEWFRPLTVGAIEMDDGVSILHLEKSEQLDLWDDGGKTPGAGPKTLVKTELGGFGRDGELDKFITIFDQQLEYQDKQLGSGDKLHKMTSPAYIGELVRLVLFELATNGIIFHGYISQELATKGSISHKDVASCEIKYENSKRCAHVLTNKLGYKKYDLADIKVMNGVCLAVVERACRLISAAIAGLSLRYPATMIGFTAHGELYETHSFIDHNIDRFIDECIHKSAKIVKVMKTSGNAPLRGAALLASRLSSNRSGVYS